LLDGSWIPDTGMQLPIATTPGIGTRWTSSIARVRWIELAMLTLPALLVSMDLTVLHLAAPELEARP